MTHQSRSFGKPLLVNALVLAGAWFLLFALSQLLRLATNGWYVIPVASLVVVPIAAVIARRCGANIALLVILGCGVWVAVEATAFALFGVGVIRGRVPHLSVFAGAMLGVGLGFVAARYLVSSGGGDLASAARP